MQGKQRAIVLGVTGFIGSGLPRMLADRGIGVTGVSRSGGGKIEGVDAWQKPANLDLAGHQIVINLAGAPIDRRWTDANKRTFHESRIGVTSRVVDAIDRLPANERPAVLVNASGVGIYGDGGDEEITEKSTTGDGYLADLCREWEAAAQRAEGLGVRVVRLRTGIVLGQGGGALQKLLPIFKAGLGGRLGTGNQWMPWIHLDDMRGAIVHAATSETMNGPMNGSAPGVCTNAEFTRTLGEVLHRPAVLPVPGFALKLGLGGFGSALLEGQRALPQALESDGFKFRFPELRGALENLVAR